MADTIEWTQSEIDELLTLRNAGMPFSQIGRRIGRSKDACKNKYKRLKDKSPARWVESGNYAEASCLVKTLDELIEAANVDLDVWKVVKYEIKAYPGWAKNERVDLRWEDGRIESGYVNKNGIESVQLWSVHAQFVRKVPVPLMPVLVPIECDVTYDAPLPKHTGLRRSLVLADMHFGYRIDEPLHDESALRIALSVARDARPDRVDILGDLLDLTDWTTKFVRTPEYQYQTQKSLLAAHAFLKTLRDMLPNAQIRLYEGNHERRLRSILMEHFAVAYGLKSVDELDLPPSISVPRLLALHKLKVDWVGDYPDEMSLLGNRVRLSHGDVVSSTIGGTARAKIESSVVSEIFGHAHRREWVSKTLYGKDGPVVIEGFCPGCLCRVDGIVPGTSASQNWQQGFAVIDYDDDHYAITPISIDGIAIWDGKVYTGEA